MQPAIQVVLPPSIADMFLSESLRRYTKLIDFERCVQGKATLLCIRFHGRLSGEQFKVAFPQLESEFGSHEELFALFDLREMEGWEPGAGWDRLRFDSEHRIDVKKIGVVGGTEWKTWIRKACRPLACPVGHFEELDEALAWLSPGVTGIDGV